MFTVFLLYIGEECTTLSDFALIIILRLTAMFLYINSISDMVEVDLFKRFKYCVCICIPSKAKWLSKECYQTVLNKKNSLDDELVLSKIVDSI